MFVDKEKRKMVLVNIINIVADEMNLSFKVHEINGESVADVSNCKPGEEKEVYASFSINILVNKYSYIEDDYQWANFMYNLTKTLVIESMEEKNNPFREQLLTTFEKHDKYYIEKCPRSDYWHNTVPPEKDYITGEIDGVTFVWSIGSEKRSIYLTTACYRDYQPEKKLKKHLEERWVKDLQNHPQFVRVFPTKAIVGMKSKTYGYVISEERMEKRHHLVPMFHGPRIFELMTYAPAAKAIINFLGMDLEKFTVFGLTQDLCFAEKTINEHEFITDEWDRELLCNLVLDNIEKRFDFDQEHRGTKIDIAKVKTLELNLKRIESDYFIKEPRFNTFFRKDGIQTHIL